MIALLVIVIAGLFCIGGILAGEWIKRNAAEFRVGGVE